MKLIALFMLFMAILTTYYTCCITPGLGITVVMSGEYGKNCYRNPHLIRVPKSNIVYLFTQTQHEYCYYQSDNSDIQVYKTTDAGTSWSSPMVMRSSCMTKTTPTSVVTHATSYLVYVCNGTKLSFREIHAHHDGREYIADVGFTKHIQLQSNGIYTSSTGRTVIPVTLDNGIQFIYSENMMKNWTNSTYIAYVKSVSVQVMSNETLYAQFQTTLDFVIYSYIDYHTYTVPYIISTDPLKKNKPVMLKYNDILYSINTDSFIKGSNLIMSYSIDGGLIWHPYSSIDKGAAYDSTVVIIENIALICYEKGWRASIHCMHVSLY